MTGWERFRGWPWWAQALVWLALWPVPLVLLTTSRPRGSRRRWWAITAFAGAAWVLFGVASAATEGGAGDAEDHPGTAAPTTEVTSSASPPGSPEGGHRMGDVETVEVHDVDQRVRTSEANTLLDTLSALPVAPEHARSGYDRGLFPQSDDADGDGCDTRCEVLSAQRRPARHLVLGVGRLQHRRSDRAPRRPRGRPWRSLGLRGRSLDAGAAGRVHRFDGQPPGGDGCQQRRQGRP